MRKALDRMRAACAVRECCEKDIREKLAKTLRSGESECGGEVSRWGSDEIVEAVIERLKEEEFLSDRRYAAAFARDKAHLLGWGPQKIRYALLAKHIDEGIVSEALGLVDSCAADAQLERMLGKKLSSLKASKKELTYEEMKARLIRFAIGRGYPYDSVGEAVSKVLSRR
ncbi:MAG: RecX family transcriptional regulator [Bacteroidales bacterium]|nr:RecX family transcriptional regulator [Bacteroidales bacterium]